MKVEADDERRTLQQQHCLRRFSTGQRMKAVGSPRDDGGHTQEAGAVKADKLVLKVPSDHVADFTDCVRAPIRAGSAEGLGQDWN